MESLIEKISVIITGIVTFFSIFVTIFYKIKSNKTSNNLTSTEKIFDYIVNELPNTIKYMEEIFPSKNGIFKLDTVLSYIEIYCLKNNIEYNREKYTDIANILVSLLNYNKNKENIKNEWRIYQYV